MTEVQQLKSELRRGSGKAFLMLQRRGFRAGKDVDKLLYEATIANWAYDPQCEGSRAAYTLELLSGYKHGYQIDAKVTAYFKRMRKLDWGAYQVFDFMKLLQKEARFPKDLILNRFRWYIRHYRRDDIPGVEAVIDVYGFDGLLEIVKEIGRLIATDKSFWPDDWPLKYAKDTLKGDLERMFARAAAEDKYVGLYKSKISRPKYRSRPRPLSVQEMVRKVATGNYKAGIWARRANAQELRELALYMEGIDDQEMIGKLLLAFAIKPFPLGVRKLLRYVAADIDLVKTNALRAMSLIRSPAARAVGQRYINSQYSDTAIVILASNFQEGDAELLIDELSKIADQNRLHSVGLDVEQALERSKAASAKLLLYLYSRIECGICRYSIVKELLHRKTLTKAIYLEAQYDSYEDTRRLLNGVTPY